MLLKAPTGTQDILPEAIPLWRYVENTTRHVFEQYGYRELRTPLFEEERLFNRSVGETTDIVEKEMYNLTTPAGPTTFVLRPELTASIVRAYLEHNFYKEKPFQKLYYLGPLFRHERPQKGRYRQFHQIGVEALGSSDPLVDVEIMDLALFFFDRLGIKGCALKINSIGCLKCRDSYRTALNEYLGKSKSELCPTCQQRFTRNIFRILDCKNKQCYTITQQVPPGTDYLCADCRHHFAAVTEALKANEIDYSVDAHLVRGFDYYTKTIFEITHPHLGSQDALCGGGRYDDLIAGLGGPQLGATGFAIGMERTILALTGTRQENPTDLQTVLPIKAFVVMIDESTRPAGFGLLKELRRHGIAADMDYESKSLKAQMRLADRVKAEYVIVLGPDEINKKSLRIKQMATGEDKEISRAEVFTYIK